MALRVCTTAFNEGGVRAEVGMIFDSTDDLVVRFPTKFSATAALSGTISVTNMGTVDPHAVGQCWNNGGTLMISGG